MTAATHRPEDPAAVHSSALSAFLAGPARGIAAVESLPAQPSYAPAHTKGGPSDGSVASEDPENIRRRRWGAGATVPSSSPRAPATPSPSEASWWQKTSWFKDGAADVAPVLADPSGADHGRGGIADASAASDGTCRNRFTGPGQRDPLRPATAKSVSLHAVEDPGEVYGGANAYARASGGGVYVPVGGAMVHSRLSIQPRARPRAPIGDELHKNAEPRRCADAFEAALRGGAPAPERVACAVASAAARVKYDFDFAKGVWAVRDTGAVVSARETSSGPDARREGERTELSAAKKKSATDATSPEPELRVQTATEVTPETSARAEETRGARLRCFAAGHDAALAAAAAKRRAREARVAAATLKRAAAQVPLPPLGATDRRRFARRAEDALGEKDAENEQEDAVETDAARWRMLRLRETGDVVFFDAPDACDALVQAWLSGETPWPEIRVMELSREARAAAGVPRGAPGPVAPAVLAAAAAEELRLVAEEDAEARRVAEEAASASAPSSAEASSRVARLPPGSTATPQQASIIERLVEATGASGAALEAAAAAGRNENENAASASNRDVESLKASLRENIREKHEFKVRATAAEARVAALEAALAAAGIEAPC
jgi:hypothetical protein